MEQMPYAAAVVVFYSMFGQLSYGVIGINIDLICVRRQLYFVEYIFGWCCLDDDDDVSQFEKYIIHKSWCLPSKMKH